ncbi:zf-DHHC-domain-containing protein [Neoconidiobolus thromboides FSU 785]|nr:zf-DHHC-domain-containing protein [Neoconidiobolus thromboides FSU 785]
MAKELKHQVMKALGYVPVVLCLMVVFWSYYAFNFVYCLDVFIKIFENTGLAAFLMSVYHVLFIFFIWTYLMVVFIHPGTPKQAWEELKKKEIERQQALEENHSFLDAEITPLQQVKIIEPEQLTKLLPDNRGNSTSNDGPVFQMITVKQSGERRFCRKCNFDKPDRTHHCSICGECILKMDHHCPWINSCVGYHNQKYFLLFIFYANLFCLFIALCLIPGVIHIFSDHLPVSINEIQLVFMLLISGLFAILLLFFVGFHIYLLVNNRTTIENLERTVYKVDEEDEPTASKYLNVFNVGKWRNFTEVFGDNIILWFLPIRSVKGNGIVYPLSAYAYNTLSTRD